MDAKLTLGEPRLLISRAALLHNARLVRAQLAPAVRVCAMVKADGYGHGAAVVADTLCNFVDGPDNTPIVGQLAVATIDEAIGLEPIGAATAVLVLRSVENTYLGRQRQAIEYAIRRGWMLTITSPAAADDVARVAIACGRRTPIHVMVDTGMTRCGVDARLLPALLARIDSLPSLRLSQLSTHFANSEVPGCEFTDAQLRTFREATDAYIVTRGRKVLRHAANSGAIWLTPASHFDIVRPGISLYGIDPTCRPNTDRPLRPVMKWTAPLIAIHDVRADTTVGYGQTWASPHDTRVGLVPVGYADGYLREFSNRAVMLLDGIECPVVGRVSMDLTTIDLGACPQARVGDEVIVLDNDPLSPCSVYVLSRLAETIPYELFARIGPRVKRVAVEPEDAPVAEEIEGAVE